MSNSVLVTEILDKGWSVFQLPNPEPIYQARRALLLYLREFTSNPEITLENYHNSFDDDDEHFPVRIAINAYARKEGLARQILMGQLELFRDILGPDVSVTTTNHWRVARSGKPQDNTGFHRDIDLGQSVWELGLWFPLVDVDEGSSLQVMSGSHLMPREKFPFHKTSHPTIERGSDLNKIGFMYAPLNYERWFVDQMRPVPMSVGQGLVFFASLMHGQEINSSASTRWSADFNLANSYAPFDWAHHGDEAKYELVTESATMKIGRMFHDFPVVSG